MPKLTTELLQQALNLVEEHGSTHRAILAGATDLPRATLRFRHHQALQAGLRPTYKKEPVKIYKKDRLGQQHMVIPDTQVKGGVNTDHLTWAANYAVDKQPDTIIMIGDWWDMPSLSHYDKGKLCFEGRRYVDDIKAGRAGMEKFLAPIDEYNRTAKVKYAPRKVFCLGNHEHRIVRLGDDCPELSGKVQLDDLGIKDYGWEMHDFLRIVKIDQIEYSHYFTSGVMGRPVSSAAALLRERQCSATMGHVQHTDMAMHKKTQNTALFCGTFYQHDESYLGAQGNDQRRQIIIKNEVADGRYDPMFISLNYLKKVYQ